MLQIFDDANLLFPGGSPAAWLWKFAPQRSQNLYEFAIEQWRRCISRLVLLDPVDPTKIFEIPALLPQHQMRLQKSFSPIMHTLLHCM